MINLMIKYFQPYSEKNELYSIKKINKVDPILPNFEFNNSKSFWIYAIYFFVSISLLTSSHMYEYLKFTFY